MVDLTFLEKFSKGDSAKMKRYIGMYLTETPLILEKMKEYLVKEDWSNLAIHAHSLKPQAEFMGVTSLKEVLMAVESRARSESPKDLEDLFHQALKLYTESSDILKQYHQNL